MDKLYWLLPARVVAAIVLAIVVLDSCGQQASAPASAPSLAGTAVLAREFDDCAGAGWCPQMVVIPAGAFVMGSPASEPGRFDDEAQRPVNVATFAIGKFPVTRGQWGAFMTATHRPTPRVECAYARKSPASWRDPGFPQGENHPVVCIT
jgi:formylglycine-generating enzyme required for sulfatase activity